MQWVTELPALPSRPDDAHKGTFGRALIIGGSRGMSGAVCLAGLGALRGGAGLVYLAVPKEIVGIVASVEPSYLTVPLECCNHTGRISTAARLDLEQALPTQDAVALGPGLGQCKELNAIVKWLYTTVQVPMVIDADGLNALAKVRHVIQRRPAVSSPQSAISGPQPVVSDPPVAGSEAQTVGPGGGVQPAGPDRPEPSPPQPPPRILTPHPGEFARLLETDAPTIQRSREDTAGRFAKENGVLVLLKGRGSVVTDGERLAVNTTGNSGMATGGTGDVLTGLITALLAQGMPPFEAAHLAAHLHGLAGDLAAEELSKPALIASDLVRYLPRAWKQLGG